MTTDLKRGENFDPEHILYSIDPRKTFLGQKLVQLSTKTFTRVWSVRAYMPIYEG